MVSIFDPLHIALCNLRVLWVSVVGPMVITTKTQLTEVHKDVARVASPKTQLAPPPNLTPDRWRRQRPNLNRPDANVDYFNRVQSSAVDWRVDHRDAIHRIYDRHCQPRRINHRQLDRHWTTRFSHSRNCGRIRTQVEIRSRCLSQTDV